MDGVALIADAFGRVHDTLHRSLSDLTPQELFAGSRPPIAWLVWHLTRVQDSNISGLAGQEQAWIADGWHARFKMPPERLDYGSGHTQTPAQVDAFSVADAQLLLDFYDAVFKRTRAYLSTLAANDLDRCLDEPKYQPLPTVGVRLVSVIADNLRHAGKVEYLRGFIKHGGWFPSLQK
ncbi:MAG: DUF664 domain-containing protein [Candidatus Binatia bacterium]